MEGPEAISNQQQVLAMSRVAACSSFLSNLSAGNIKIYIYLEFLSYPKSKKKKKKNTYLHTSLYFLNKLMPFNNPATLCARTAAFTEEGCKNVTKFTLECLLLDRQASRLTTGQRTDQSRI